MSYPLPPRPLTHSDSGDDCEPAALGKPCSKDTARFRRVWRRRSKRPIPRATAAGWTPPGCPNARCRMHAGGEGRWFRKKGFHWPLCRSRPVQRFVCKECGRGFSLSTFRADYRDKKPWHNTVALGLLTKGPGLRETARTLFMSRTALQMKARKMSAHCLCLHRNLMAQARLGPRFMMDEAVTFEGDRRLRPLNLAVMIDRGSYLIMDWMAARMAPHGSRSKKTEEKLRRLEERFGKRVDRSRIAVTRVIRTMLESIAARNPRFFELSTDLEPTYESILLREAARLVPNAKVEHLQYLGSEDPRDTKNPLFRINFTFGLMRDRLSRLRRRSWLHSKMRRWLNRMMAMFVCVRNYVRPVRNDGQFTPGEMVFIPEGRLTMSQVLGWRQDLGKGVTMGPTAKVG